MRGKSRNHLANHLPGERLFDTTELQMLTGHKRAKDDYDIVLVPKELSLTGETTSFITELYVLYLHKYSLHFSQ